jgi:type 1 glutamine amidotransferase
VTIACSHPAPNSESGTEVLVFTRAVAFRHASIGAGVDALRELASDAGVGLTATEDPEVFTVRGLSDYDAVVFLSTTGDVLNDDQQEALEDFVRAGGGFAGIHAASDTEYDWPWYGQLVGAYFAWHPPEVRTGTLLVVEEDHPATTGLPSPWIRQEEWYDLRDLQPGVSVLLEVDETTYKTPAEDPLPEPRPIAWYREFDGGRTFYTALGHAPESFTEPTFRSHIWGGIAWVLDL